MRDFLWGSLPVIVFIAVVGILFPTAQALLPDNIWVWSLIGIIGLAFYVSHKIEKRIDR